MGIKMKFVIILNCSKLTIALIILINLLSYVESRKRRLFRDPSTVRAISTVSASSTTSTTSTGSAISEPPTVTAREGEVCHKPDDDKIIVCEKGLYCRPRENEIFKKKVLFYCERAKEGDICLRPEKSDPEIYCQKGLKCLPNIVHTDLKMRGMPHYCQYPKKSNLHEPENERRNYLHEPENERRNYLHEPETIQPKETIKTINTQTRIINKKINEHPGTGYLPSSLPPSSRPKETIQTINTPMKTVTHKKVEPYETSPNTGIKKKKPY